MAATLQRKRKGAYHHGDLERALVEAALRTIRREGVQGLTLRGVGAQLGVSRTALYRHFKTRRPWSRESRSRASACSMMRSPTAIARAEREESDPLEEMARAYVRFAMANQSHYQTMFGGFLDRLEPASRPR